MTRQESPPPRTPPPTQAADSRRLDSRALLGSRRELLIQHNGELYRLRLTRAGKLILTK
jgi:hemin uptake protein HemP